MKYFKKNVPQESHRSHYEDQWSYNDYQDHNAEFEKMLIEYNEIRKQHEDSAVISRMVWLERQGAVKLVDIGDRPEPLVRSNYTMYAAKFDRFTEWCAFRDKKEGIKPVSPVEVDSLERLANEMAEKMTV